MKIKGGEGGGESNLRARLRPCYLRRLSPEMQLQGLGSIGNGA